MNRAGLKASETMVNDDSFNAMSMKHVPSSLSFVVQTALGIPGRSELTTSSTSNPWRSILKVLRPPRPQAANI